MNIKKKKDLYNTTVIVRSLFLIQSLLSLPKCNMNRGNRVDQAPKLVCVWDTIENGLLGMKGECCLFVSIVVLNKKQNPHQTHSPCGNIFVKGESEKRLGRFSKIAKLKVNHDNVQQLLCKQNGHNTDS